MTMRMLGVQGELTGPVIELGERDFTMDVEGEEFRAKVSCPPDLLAALSPGELVFVVGRIHFREFDAGRLLVDAQRVHRLTDSSPSGQVPVVDPGADEPAD